MTNQASIRVYHPKDKAAVIQLLQLNTPTYFAIEEENDLHNYLDNEREDYYVVILEEKIVGCGGINYADNKTTGKISWDIFHPEVHGKSLGSKLLKYRIDFLHTKDSIKKITVRTSQVAYKFYEKQGFELLEITKDYWAPGFDLYAMEYRKA